MRPAMSSFLQITMQQRFLGFGALMLQYLVAVVRRVMAFALSPLKPVILLDKKQLERHALTCGKFG